TEPVVAATNRPSPGPVAAVSPALNPDAVNSDTVTGVKTGHAKLDIPVGTYGYKTRADWYLPTQADGTVSATGVIWLQHGFLNRKLFVSALATTLSQQTNSIVVAPNIASFPLRCSGCWLNGAPMQEAVASMFLGDRELLNSSANAAGYQGVLPEDFVLSGQSAGGGFATAVGGYYATDPGNDSSLRGVVMFDGFSFSGVVQEALAKLDDPYVPVYQVAAPPQLWNSFGATTEELVAARPDRFVGATLAGGSHADALLGGNPIVDFFAQLVTKFSPPGNTEAVYTLATGWINDLYQGLGPTDGNGIYGDPDQYIVMGDTAAVVLAPPPVVDLDRYLGTWYEVGSVKQFFSIGLVNTKAVYSLNADGSIKVENSGNYFFNNGPESSIVGSALPVDPDNNKLNVSFLFPPSTNPPGNYWIVDLSPGYSELDPDGWAIVSDPTGLTGFLLSRRPVVSDELYQELLDRSSVKGVRGRITPTRQYVSATATLMV
ncbi:MAG: lipocalin family protein, partial [Actinomycetia bacterium]|nr:lipocalin family protein [Actinomycetes bacterium]